MKAENIRKCESCIHYFVDGKRIGRCRADLLARGKNGEDLYNSTLPSFMCSNNRYIAKKN